MDAYSQNFQFAAKLFFVRHYCNFENLYLKLGGETLEDIILIIFGGRPCKTAMGLYYYILSAGGLRLNVGLQLMLNVT